MSIDTKNETRISITGSLNDHNIDDVKRILLKYGLIWSNTVNETLDLLVVGEKPDIKPLLIADELAIPCLDWKEFKRNLTKIKKRM
ncbi:MAG: BRCT domain-containing protein [Candidatus Hodarchaeales archaeon]|jgi:NAD-dependent DNA ligase